MAQSSYTRRTFLKALAAATVLPNQLQAAKQKLPNFVIIMADDMGYNATSVYDGWIKTPNLERLAKVGMTFTDFHSSGTVCSPTRAGLMTGRYQERAGIPGVVYAAPDRPVHYNGLQHSEHTFAELLNTKGYTSGLMGKWHLGYLKKYNPKMHGFTQYHGFVSGNVDYISHYDGSVNYDWWDGLKLVDEPGYSTHLINAHALKFIDQNKDDPFCLYVAHEAVHSPFQGPASQPQRGPEAGKKPGAVKLSQQEAYIQMMTEMDKGVGQIVKKLKDLGLTDNTLVFFFSDNGHAYLGPEDYKTFPLRGKKATVWEGGHRVPAIASWPGKIKPGTTNDGLYITLDIMPTLLAISGAAAPKGHKFDGLDLSETLFEGKEIKKRKLFWLGKAMRDGNWKLVDQSDGGLFDLSKDLAEQKDLSKKFPDRVKQMKKAIEAWKTDVETGATAQPNPTDGSEKTNTKSKKG
jgi:arylsulfatase A-like enzyme